MSLISDNTLNTSTKKIWLLPRWWRWSECLRLVFLRRTWNVVDIYRFPDKKRWQYTQRFLKQDHCKPSMNAIICIENIFRFGVSVGFWSIFRFLKGGDGGQWWWCVLSIILTYWLDVVVYNGSSKGHSLSVQGKVRDKKFTSYPIFSRLRSILFIQIISSSLSGLTLLSSPIRRCHHIDIMRECSLESGHHILENKR